jgi:predicted metal-dependent phosphoesterase TrpH
MFADLHLHTHFSDGTYGPEELAALAQKHGLKAVALTDHDTMEGCERAASACAERGVEFIPASELTAELGDVELHLIGYFLDSANEKLRTELARFQHVRQHIGVPLQAEAVFTLANCAAPGRPHVARALVQQKLVSNLDEAFDRFLKKGKPAWVPKFKMSALQAIELIHQAGGLAVMAHPGLNRTDDIIPALIKAGLDGIECFHTKHSTHVTEHYLEIAEKYNLLVTGGSDCHGISKGKPLIGTMRIPYVYVERLKEAHLRKALASGAQIANSGAASAA